MNNNNSKSPTNLIGINGKIGSGKDTVGKIIQHLTSNWSDEEFVDTHMLDIRSSWEIKKFAGKLKQIASLLSGIPVKRFEDQEFKQKQMSEGWEMTYREFLQKLGTEAMRNGLHTNVWVNALFANYNAIGYKYKDCDYKVTQGKWEYPNWIITDMRFPNEMEAIIKREGITIRVNRPGINLLDHPSETSLDTAEFNYTIDNSGTIEELIKKVKDILVKEKII
jgi:hypothetical protein